eukprot:6474558-Amphidinium_carterae.1
MHAELKDSLKEWATHDTSSEDEDGNPREKLQNNPGGYGLCIRTSRDKDLCDGFGLCSPGRWPVGMRRRQSEW